MQIRLWLRAGLILPYVCVRTKSVCVNIIVVKKANSPVDCSKEKYKAWNDSSFYNRYNSRGKSKYKPYF